MLEKKIWANFQRIIELFTQKIVTKLSKIWVWYPGSEIRKKPIPDPGVKKAPDPGSGSTTLARNVSKYCSNLLGKEGLFFGRQTELLLVVNLKQSINWQNFQINPCNNTARLR
jgi:hypothetical protein